MVRRVLRLASIDNAIMLRRTIPSNYREMSLGSCIVSSCILCLFLGPLGLATSVISVALANRLSCEWLLEPNSLKSAVTLIQQISAQSDSELTVGGM